MNCKPGDLAVFVKSIAGNEGRIVRCLSFAGTGDEYYTDCWFVDPPVEGTLALHYAVSDSKLKPIRDNDGTDETLTWADVPRKEHA